MVHRRPLTLWLKFTPIAFSSHLKIKTVQLLELMVSKEHAADGHDGSHAAAACFATCLDLKDVADRGLEK